MQSPAALAGAFRARGLKVTPQRQLLFGLLDGNTSHPTADTLFVEASAQMPGISLRTVYTTLTDLAEMGEIQSLSLGGGAVRFDPNVEDHDHGLCVVCESITDVYVGGLDKLSISAPAEFTPQSASIVFHGICAQCAGTAQRSTQVPTTTTPQGEQQCQP